MINSKMSKDKSKVSLLTVIKVGIKINWRTTPVFFVVNNIITIICGTLFGFVTFVTQGLYDSVGEVVKGNKPISQAYLMIIVLVTTFVLKEIFNGINLFLDGVIYNKNKCMMNQIIHDKMAKIDPIYLEDTKLLDDIEKASEGADTVLYIVSMGMAFFTFNLPYLLFMGIYLHNLKSEFVLVIIMVFIPIILSQCIRSGIISKFEDKAAPIRREQKFYTSAITSREYYKETRMLGAYSFFAKKLICSLKKLGNAEWKMKRNTNILEMILSVVSGIGYVGILFMLVSSLISGEITAGAFAAVFGSIGMLFSVMSEMVNYQIADMAKNMGTAHNFIRFIEMAERHGLECEPDFEKGIVANDIEFIYPNADHNSITGVNLEIKKGETIAIVGENGAGKTTLVRLLVGLYIPTVGRVILNGMDTAKVCNNSLFKGVSGVFQKFQRYQMTLDDNIRISDVNATDEIDRVVEQAGLDITDGRFTKGKNTMLSREFDGVDLSGGQWQRIAIARGLYRYNQVIVLDEPTASIDPLEESRIYHQFVKISKRKTAIIVTHRLGATKIADRVIVMQKGKIIGVGTHSELLRKCPVYANMYAIQAEWYKEEQ